MDLFAPMDPGKVDDLGGYLDLPQSEIDRIQNNYQTPNQKKEAYLDLYVHQHPYPTWSQITRVLRWKVMFLQQADLVENTYIKGTQDTPLSGVTIINSMKPSIHCSTCCVFCDTAGIYNARLCTARG